ncbi:MAG: hypothetical protein PHH91_08895 [Desulfuromonadaceae bacterium]|nr:hypothetical protein [Desulfuromonadaceae bacterium]
MENSALNELLKPSLPDCYKKDHSFYTLPSAAKCLKCTVDVLKEQILNGDFERFAQTILIDTDKYPDGREYLRKPVFRITEMQLERILDKNGDLIDLDIDLNGWLWSVPPRQVRVEITDLRVALPNCDFSDAGNRCNCDDMSTPRVAKGTAPITQVIKEFLDTQFASHSKVSFYEYVKTQLTKKETGKKESNFSFSVKKIGTGVEKGLFMYDAKEGKEGLSKLDFWYSDKEIGERLAKAKAAHNATK